MYLLRIFLFCLFNSHLCWSYLLLPFTAKQKIKITVPNSNSDVGEPLILTPLLKSNKVEQARRLSDVQPLIPNIASNAGYFTVDEKYNSNLFFWFFRKKGNDWNWKKAPVLLWLQGGPGCSSMFGLFEENGPFFVTKNGLKKRKFAWTNDFNVLYVDQPIGTGYSFTKSSNGYINNQSQVADHLYEALTQFFVLYSELKNNEFYITGESYAGKYIPAIAYRIHRSKISKRCDINLKGLFIISAWSDPSNMVYYSEFYSRIGIIDSKVEEEILSVEKKLESSILSKQWKEVDLLSDIFFDKFFNNSQISSIYDYSALKEPNDRYIEYIQSETTRQKIHVGNITFYGCSDLVYYNFSADIYQSVKVWIEELLEVYPITFIGGQLDAIVPYPLVENVLEKLRWSGALKYRTAARNIFYDDRRRVAGYYKSAKNLKDICIRNAGHMVPGQQPKITLDLLNKFIDKTL